MYTLLCPLASEISQTRHHGTHKHTTHTHLFFGNLSRLSLFFVLSFLCHRELTSLTTPYRLSLYTDNYSIGSLKYGW